LTRLLAPGLAWTGEGFETGQGAWLDDAGHLERVGPLGDAEPDERLPDQALLPGFVSAHSHAFQIGLRGHGETFPAGAGSFWTWREAMYELVESMTRERLYELSKRCFEEMLAAGITTVGEFHYLHHLGDGLDFEGDHVVLDAARDAGIRMVLLVTYYETGGIGRLLEGGQRRFATQGLGPFWEHVDHLGSTVDGERMRLGVAAHSIRAVPPAILRELWREARRRGLPFHMHVEEQRQEIEDSLAAYGQRPMEIVLDLAASSGDDLQGFTAVHCTHTRVEDLRRFAAAGGRACICPLTEANLGDGIPALGEVPEIHDRLCLGTDSNHRIDMLEEMRWLEYGQRLRYERRGVLREGGETAAILVGASSPGGSEALGCPSQPPTLLDLPADPAQRSGSRLGQALIGGACIRPRRRSTPHVS
jgi:formimidoylglutamate deiminase